MTAPRIEVDLAKITDNTRRLVDQLGPKGISVTGVTKSFLGAEPIATAMINGGVTALGDSRLGNLRAMRGFGVDTPMQLIRSPMLSEVDQVVELSTLSFNTELVVLAALSQAALGRSTRHDVVVMVELGDLREGVMVQDVDAFIEQAQKLRGTNIVGIGCNLACQSGVIPDATNMDLLSTLAEAIERRCGTELAVISGGNSASLTWALSGADTGRVNALRLGEAILLGRNPLDRHPVDGLHTDALSVVAEVIEVKRKPSQPWGGIARSAFGTVRPRARYGTTRQALLAIGRQDVDPAGLTPCRGITILGTSSDHLVVDIGETEVEVGQELRFEPDYSALVRAMTSPFVARAFIGSSSASAA